MRRYGRNQGNADGWRSACHQRRIRSVTTTPPTGGNGTPFEATGSITDFVSLASFRVGGVLIDGSSATFVDGTASDLRNGALIEVNGTLVNGAVRHTYRDQRAAPIRAHRRTALNLKPRVR